MGTGILPCCDGMSVAEARERLQGRLQSTALLSPEDMAVRRHQLASDWQGEATSKALAALLWESPSTPRHLIQPSQGLWLGRKELSAVDQSFKGAIKVGVFLVSELVPLVWLVLSLTLNSPCAAPSTQPHLNKWKIKRLNGLSH